MTSRISDSRASTKASRQQTTSLVRRASSRRRLHRSCTSGHELCTLSPAATVLDETPAVVAAIYAHPDDAEISCGGTLAKWVAAGAEVHLLICTLGDKGAVESDTDVDLLVRERAL